MSFDPEQIAAAQKANLESLFGLTTKAFEGVEKLIELNLQVVKSTLAEGQENAQRLLSVKDAQELIALQASLSQPVAEKVLSYGRHLYEIASSTQAEFAKVAEAQFEEQNKKVQALVDNVAKNAPARNGCRCTEVGTERCEHHVRNGSEGHEASRRNR